MKITSKILTPVLSFFAGIIVTLGLLMIPIGYLFLLLFNEFGNDMSLPAARNLTLRNLTLVFISVAFFIIGIIVNKLFQKKFPRVNPFLTIPFAFPMVLLQIIEPFLGPTTNGKSAFELLLILLISLVSLLAYIAGVIITQQKQTITSTQKIAMIIIIILLFFPFKEPEYTMMRGGNWTTPLIYFLKEIEYKITRNEYQRCVEECVEEYNNRKSYQSSSSSSRINSCGIICNGPDEKPVIYLYPKQKQNIHIQLDYNGKIIADYPSYDEKLKGWSITAYPDGKIINHADNQEYSYLFWEGQPKEKIDWDLSKGFIVKGEDTKEFLQKTLSQIGLTPKEYNEFIVYWFPQMQNNQYNLIHFADEQYTDNAPLTINPKPDSVLRVFMVYKSLEEPIKIEEQEIKPFERNGFTVVEWGGTKAE